MDIVKDPKLDTTADKVAEAIAAFQQAVEGIEDEELAAFERSLGQMETVMPYLDPTAYEAGGADAVRISKAGVLLIKECKKLPQVEL